MRRPECRETMKTVSQVLFGLLLGVTGIVVCFWLGLLVTGGSPDWRSAVVLLLLIAVTGSISYFAFRRHIAVQVLFGLALSVSFCLLRRIRLCWHRRGIRISRWWIAAASRTRFATSGWWRATPYRAR